jgi:hypothetical protein
VAAAFELRIVRHGWLYDGDAAEDLCSHDELSVIVDGVELAPAGAELSASMAGLALLRSLGDADVPETERWRGGYDFMVPHGCGYPIVLGCGNVGIDWSVEHADGVTTIRDVQLQGLGRGTLAARLGVQVPTSQYLGEVVDFARAAREFYFLEPKRLPEDAFERDSHRAFWSEYERRLAFAEQSDRAMPDGRGGRADADPS